MNKFNFKAALITFLIFISFYFASEQIVIFRQKVQFLDISKYIEKEYRLEKQNEAQFILEAHQFSCKMDINELTDILIYIDSLCKVYSVDYQYVKAIISTESRWNHTAIGCSNDYGLMQITPIGAKAVKQQHGDCQFDPFYNIETGIKLLNQLFIKTGSIEASLVGYNAGIGNVQKYGDDFVKNSPYLVHISKWLDFFQNYK